MRFYRDDSHLPRAETDTPSNILGFFLESDIQSDILECKLLLNTIQRVREEGHTHFDGAGNCCILTIHPEYAEIALILTNLKFRLPLNMFEEAINGWLNIISN